MEWPEGLWVGLLYDVFVYVAIVGTAQAIGAHAQALRLRNDLLESELRMLRMQLQPHFLFNTLHGVAELVHRDPASAERALMRLADLLRWTLQSSAAREVSVREELAALETYLEIQRLRHGPGVVMRVEADADTMGLGMPGLLLQPLVENALRHGVRSTDVAGVHVRVRRDGDRLLLAVTDDGRGLAPGFRVGTGLRATRARLAGLYGADQRFEIGGADGRGTRVAIAIPARSLAAGAVNGATGAPSAGGAR
jgi:LytS/YehU family sensor histidine kinase